MLMNTRLRIAFCSACAESPSARRRPRPRQSPTRRHVETLASPELEGRHGRVGRRATGRRLPRRRAAAHRRASRCPGQTDYRLAFEFTAGVEGRRLDDHGRSPGRERRRSSAHARDVQALSFSDNGEVSGPVVFAGYGLVVPESQNFGYDSYAGLDVKDKVVLVLRYFPEDADQQTRAMLARYSDLRYKAQAARQRGAKALLVVTGPRSPNAGEVVPMTFDTALAGSGIVAASVERRGRQGDLRGHARQDPRERAEGIRHRQSARRRLCDPGRHRDVKAAVERESADRATTSSAYLPATTPADAVTKPWVALGAHYDHLGRGTTATRSPPRRRPARSTTAPTTTRRARPRCSRSRSARRSRRASAHLIVGFWSAEEIGLIGSNAFVTTPPVPTADLAAYLNFDMVGRIEDNKLTVQATGTSPVWPKMLEQANVAAGFDLVAAAGPVPADRRGQLQPGQRRRASRSSPARTWTITARGHRRQDQLRGPRSRRLVRERHHEAAARSRRGAAVHQGRTEDRPGAARRPAHLHRHDSRLRHRGQRTAARRRHRRRPGRTGRACRRATSSSRSPARSIANIYDYTYALELLKIGEPVKVVYLRGGERRETTLTPAARK